jgi:hypothetical protein
MLRFVGGSPPSSMFDVQCSMFESGLFATWLLSINPAFLEAWGFLGVWDPGDLELPTGVCHGSWHGLSRQMSRVKSQKSLGKSGIVTVSRVKTPGGGCLFIFLFAFLCDLRVEPQIPPPTLCLIRAISRHSRLGSPFQSCPLPRPTPAISSHLQVTIGNLSVTCGNLQ